MEHILQFAIDIDDERIKQIAEEKAAKAVIKSIQSSISEFTDGSYYNPSKLDKMFREAVENVVKENKETIIQEAVNKVATNISKQKACKQLVADMIEDFK